tara:strand:- start:7487 stop:7666 length:180 start_codon:yes stop_codon:yes gene_type:complete
MTESVEEAIKKNHDIFSPGPTWMQWDRTRSYITIDGELTVADMKKLISHMEKYSEVDQG